MTTTQVARPFYETAIQQSLLVHDETRATCGQKKHYENLFKISLAKHNISQSNLETCLMTARWRTGCNKGFNSFNSKRVEGADARHASRHQSRSRSTNQPYQCPTWNQPCLCVGSLCVGSVQKSGEK